MLSLLSTSLYCDFVNLVPSSLPFLLPIWLRRKRRTEHRKHHRHPLSAVSSRSIHFHFLRDLSCKKLTENKGEEAMNEKKKQTKETFFHLRKDGKLKMKLLL
jgi:hypothetical protein